jgi:hypothetical protein
MIDIIDLINNPNKLDASTLSELKVIVDRYPFFSTARLLYVANLFAMHSENFGKELRKAAVFVPDRSVLFQIVEGMNYKLENVRKNEGVVATEEDANRTISLIDSFLSTTKTDEKHEAEKDTTTTGKMPTLADVTTDYAAFLLRQENENEVEQAVAADMPRLRGQDLIDSFIEQTKGKQRVEMAELPAETGDYFPVEASTSDEEIYTETMTNIYIKQGRYSQALEILRKICLNNPKKSAYFATQIKLLEIIVNENQQA